MKELLKKKTKRERKTIRKGGEFRISSNVKTAISSTTTFCNDAPDFYSTKFFSAFIRMLKRLLKRQMITPNLKAFRDFPPC